MSRMFSSGILSGKKVYLSLYSDCWFTHTRQAATALHAFTQVGYSINGDTTLPAPPIMNEAGAYFGQHHYIDRNVPSFRYLGDRGSE